MFWKSTSRLMQTQHKQMLFLCGRVQEEISQMPKHHVGHKYTKSDFGVYWMHQLPQKRAFQQTVFLLPFCYASYKRLNECSDQTVYNPIVAKDLLNNRSAIWRPHQVWLVSSSFFVCGRKCLKRGLLFVFIHLEKHFQCKPWPHHSSLVLRKWRRVCKHDYFDYMSIYLSSSMLCVIILTINQPLRCTIYGDTTENTSTEKHIWEKPIICSLVFHYSTSINESDMTDIFLTQLQSLDPL